jgi:hypothetical protein
LRSGGAFAYTADIRKPFQRNAQTMIRTPTSSVTATTIAARAFSWAIPSDAQRSDYSSGNSPLLR